eukprot:gene33116-38407_t
MDMDFNNVFDADQLGKRTISTIGRTAPTDSSDPNKRQNLLRDLVPHLKSMDWVRSLEFRSKAKVPIINFTHKNGLQCDLSVGISAQDTSEVVRKIKDICGPSFAPLAAFLKVLLWQQNLDKPFTGGLGSYKLYIMLAHHLLFNHSMFAPGSEGLNNPYAALGLQLLTFFKFFGSPRNLNSSTEITLPFLDEQVSFRQTFQVDRVQKLFDKCYGILHRICKERITMSNKPSGDEEADKSYSALAYIIDSARLREERAVHLSFSRSYPILND